MNRQAKFWKKIDDNTVQCFLCSHNCKIKNGKMGVCGVRKNENNVLLSMIYGSASSVAVDPIEKKPLYHFHPGSNVFSIGSVGCNFKCLHCQNSSISTADTSFAYIREFSVEEVVEMAEKQGCSGIAWTYNEPTIWYEFTYDVSKFAKKQGLYTVYVTNGYIQEEPLRGISSFLDAINVDVKGFTEDFYKKVCKASLEPVLRTCETAKKLGIHLELTYLVIPTYNDSLDELQSFCKWVVDNLGADIPVHFTRFHPDHELLDVPATSMDSLLKVFDIAKENGVLYPYLGNVSHGGYENTVCPSCGSVCIDRKGFDVDTLGLDKNKCKKCGKALSII